MLCFLGVKQVPRAPAKRPPSCPIFQTSRYLAEAKKTKIQTEMEGPSTVFIEFERPGQSDGVPGPVLRQIVPVTGQQYHKEACSHMLLFERCFLHAPDVRVTAVAINTDLAAIHEVEGRRCCPNFLPLSGEP